jgi:glycerol-3-phosphate O-acyltransferase
MREWSAARGLDWRALGKEARAVRVEELGGALMAAVARVIPALPVSLLATALLEGGGEAPVSTIDLHARTQSLMRRLGAAGAHVYLPREDEAYAIEVGLRTLVQRRVLVERDGGWVTAPGEEPVLRYYAAAISPLLAGSPPSGQPVAPPPSPA